MGYVTKWQIARATTTPVTVYPTCFSPSLSFFTYVGTTVSEATSFGGGSGRRGGRRGRGNGLDEVSFLLFVAMFWQRIKVSTPFWKGRNIYDC